MVEQVQGEEMERIIRFYFDERVFNFAVPNTPRGVAALQNIHMLRDTHTVAYKM